MERFDNNGVTSIKGSVGVHGVNMNVYMYLTDGVLIDTGSESLLSEYIPFFQAGDYDQVILTHSHEDHTGGARWIQENRQVPLYIHPMAIDECRADGVYPDYRKELWGERKAFKAEPLPMTFHSRTSKWQAIHTPGHAEDHLVFLNQESGTLFSGDLFVAPKLRIVMEQESIAKHIDSLKKVLTYDFEEIYCSHAGYIPNGKQLLKKKLDQIVSTQEEIMELHSQGLSSEEINQQLFPREYPLAVISGGEWDSRHIIRSVIADNE
ncbi:glyoxylase-like metal-dependent hydrolase (beta-lactamase superfamily II) [Bacillus ectoiniformans]|uniref:MBL fold metallo-hydrolase n=1 Tax=Bacillus ectoiniformans TaxID=1494429 RepID=UPI00195CE997|nr:MBL fold metallo-hydrolase [Bacillus ectoiniformans]MBM7649462.1 glyoxylase-like metal-dependent hydrolase (beta-lactamase superfamily II) [Bacillus ectoiniformans]